MKNNTAQQAQLPKGTGIITQVPFPAQDIQFCYRTDEDYSVNDMKITSIHSLLLEKIRKISSEPIRLRYVHLAKTVE